MAAICLNNRSQLFGYRSICVFKYYTNNLRQLQNGIAVCFQYTGIFAWISTNYEYSVLIIASEQLLQLLIYCYYFNGNISNIHKKQIGHSNTVSTMHIVI